MKAPGIKLTSWNSEENERSQEWWCCWISTSNLKIDLSFDFLFLSQHISLFKSVWGFFVCLLLCLFFLALPIQNILSDSFPIYALNTDGKPRRETFRNLSKLVIVISIRVLVTRGWPGQQKIKMEPGKSILLA